MADDYQDNRVSTGLLFLIAAVLLLLGGLGGGIMFSRFRSVEMERLEAEKARDEAEAAKERAEQKAQEPAKPVGQVKP
jgi:F0F1-type ATP synthase membrane subunit b/b'